MNTLPLEALEQGGLNAPRKHVSLANPGFDIRPGAVIYDCDLPRNTQLECLSIIQGPGPLVVSFHGALLRKKYQLPRFERLKTLLDLGVNALFFSDPSLRLSRRLELAWFTGWAGIELHEIIGNWISTLQETLEPTSTLLTGSSGGGFAALQTAPFVEDSSAVVFNPQTQLDKYLVGGRADGLKAQQDYLRVLYPELLKPGSGLPSEWAQLVGDKASVLARYENTTNQSVHFWSNPEDFHHESHYLPLADFAKTHPSSIDLQSHFYKTRPGHRPPPTEVFVDAIHLALNI